MTLGAVRRRPLASVGMAYEVPWESAMRYVLKLYVTGKGSLSVQALVTVRRLCEDEFPGRYDLEVIDVLKDPGRAEDDGIDVTPTLLRKEPEPVSYIVGDFSERERVRTDLLAGEAHG
jgi:circadian clock protein KaiB